MTLKVALLGDSMTSRWGAGCPELQAELSRLFNRTEFEIFNHALNNCRAGYGLYQVTHDYKDSAGQYHPSLSFSNPDIVVVESFAYTNSSDDSEGIAEYQDVLRRIFQEVHRTTAAKMLFCITLPPDRDHFAENFSYHFNTSKATRRRLADRTALYLEEAQRIAADEGWPVADVYADLLKRTGEGDTLSRYINQSDNVHPSLYGYQAIARVIVRALDDHRMVEEASGH